MNTLTNSKAARLSKLVHWLAPIAGILTLALVVIASTSQADSGSSRAYVTVVVADALSDPDNPATSLTIDFHTIITCSRGDYNAYISNVVDFIDGIPKRHLGSAASDNVQITSTISDLQGKGLTFDVEVYCGTDSGWLSSRVSIPHDEGPTSSESNRRLVLGTYSSEPPLTSLAVNHGTLTPTFHSHTRDYSVSDIANANDRITITTSVKSGYSIIFARATYLVSHCPQGGRCTITYKDADGNSVDPLGDADNGTPGFQVDIAEGEDNLMIHVHQELVHMAFYRLTVTRAAPSPDDATLSTLTLSDVNFGAFASGKTPYTAQVANSVSQTTVTPTVNNSGASYVIKLGGVTDADGVIPLSVGSNVITVEVTAEDDSTTQTYTVTVTRAARQLTPR